jgi:hypothetical protein
MTDHSDTSSLKKRARIAGLWYLAMAIVSAFGLLYVPSRIIVRGDAAATAGNILNAEPLFRLGILSVLVGQLIFVVVALELYNLFKDVNKNQARLMVALVVAAVPVMFTVALNQIGVLIVLHRPEYLKAFTLDQLNGLAGFLLDLYGHGEIIIGFFWGLWLLPFGSLAYSSGFIPKLLGILLIVGCAGYLIVSTLYVLSPASYDTVSGLTTILMSVGEPLMMLWLVVFGVKRPEVAEGV